MDVELQQKEILGRIYSSDQLKEQTEVDGLLKVIRDYSVEEVSYVMGEFGTRLRAFSYSIDLTHPDLRRIFNGQLVGETDGTFSKDACDLLKLAVYGRGWGLSPNVLENLKQVIKKHDYFKILNQVVDSPLENQLHVRFVPTPLLRQQIRYSKRAQPVSLVTLYKNGKSMWDSHPDNFQCYYRYTNRFQKELNQIEERKNHFLNHGLTAMASEIQKAIDEIKLKAVNETYYGFNRISMVSVCIILGKMLGYEICEDYKHGHSSMGVVAFAKPNVFKEYDFFDDRCYDEMIFWHNKVEYYPIAYTYEELKDEASPEIIKLVDYLESFPEIGGKPLFDHYRVLVPGLNYLNHYQTSPFHIKALDGNRQFFDSIQNGQFELDQHLLKTKVIVGVLLGDVDGDHYFISYFYKK
jgi:hypothetical protein